MDDEASTLAADTTWLERQPPEIAASAAARKLLHALENLHAHAGSRGSDTQLDARLTRIALASFLGTLPVAKRFVDAAARSLTSDRGPFTFGESSGATPHEAIVAMAIRRLWAIALIVDLGETLQAQSARRLPEINLERAVEKWEAIAEKLAAFPPFDAGVIEAHIDQATRLIGKDPEDSPRPRWDRHKKTLYVGETIAKRFTREAPNQFAVFDAFQEENWPDRIDDPLVPRGDIDRQRRVNDTAKELNERLEAGLQFSTDGMGTGFLWRFLRNDG